MRKHAKLCLCHKANNEWTDVTVEEARGLYEALQDALGERGMFRFTPEQAEAIRNMGD